MASEPGFPPPDADDDPSRQQTQRKDPRTRYLWRQALVLGVLLVFTLVVARTCGSDHDDAASRPGAQAPARP
ncbi:MAG: hypothetical protein ABW012_06440 [Gaiellaceae bacterium]